MSGYVVPLVFSLAPSLGTAIWGANQNPRVNQSANNLFSAIKNRNLSDFKHELSCLISLSADVASLCSDNGLTLIQDLAANHKAEANEYIDWPELISEGPNGRYYSKDHSKRENINFMHQAHTTISELINPNADEYLMADKPENIAFLLLAGTDDVLIGDIFAALIEKATAKQFTKMQELAPSALRAAVTEGSGKTVGVLIKKFALDPNQRLEDGKTILHIACEKGFKDQYDLEDDRSTQIRALLENGADPTLRDDAGKMPGEDLDFWYLTQVPEILKAARIAAKANSKPKL